MTKRVRSSRLARTAWLTLLLSALATRPVQGAAHNAGVALYWRAPLGSRCSSQAGIEALLARLTDHLALSQKSQPHRYRIEALITQAGERWRARLVLFDGQHGVLGAREIETRTDDCQALDVPASVIISTLVDGLRAQVASAGSQRERASLGGFVIGALGLGPTPWWGAGLSFAFATGIPVVLDAGTFLPGARLDDRGRGARYWGSLAGISACPRLTRGMPELRGCVGLQLGALWARGVGLTFGDDKVLPMLLIGLEPTLVITLPSGWFVQLSISASWLAVRPRFAWTIEGDNPGRLDAEQFSAQLRVRLMRWLPWWP